MSRKVPFIIGLTVIVLSGLAHGLWTGRWRSSAELTASVAKLAKVPMELGDWRGTDMDMNPRELKQAGILGHVYRRYQNSKTGEAVTVFLVSGSPGPISVHSPEVCYPGVGYVQKEKRTETSIGSDKFWTIRLSKDTALSRSNITVHFGWDANGEWVAPDGDPRLSFATYPVLYKMYLIQDQRPLNLDAHSDAGTEFAKVFLPVLRSTLFTSTST